MPKKLAIPPALRSGPFTAAAAATHGITADQLRGPYFIRLFRGVYVVAGTTLTLWLWLAGALLLLPGDAAVSHVSALWLYGVDIGPQWPLQFSTNTTQLSKHSRIELHRRVGRLTTYSLRELQVLGPDRTFVDVARQLTFVQLVQTAGMLLNLQHTTLEMLWDIALTRHIYGVVRARRVLAYVRENVESPMETLVRLMVVFARLPEPQPNPDILDADGRFIARGDMVYVRWKVLVEYDGWQHERDARQRQRDRERREALEALGWRVIVITSADLRSKREVVRRVYRAIKARGYDGPAPRFNDSWDTWFPSI